MKTLRSLLAVAFAAAFATTAAFADHHGKKADAKPEKAACGCAVGTDGKVCGVDKDCCCKGGKAKGEAKSDAAKAKGADKKACCATDACAESGCKAEKGKKSEKKADKGANCEACTACPETKADKK